MRSLSRQVMNSSLLALVLLGTMSPPTASAEEEGGDCQVSCSINSMGKLICTLKCTIIIHF